MGAEKSTECFLKRKKGNNSGILVSLPFLIKAQPLWASSPSYFYANDDFNISFG